MERFTFADGSSSEEFFESDNEAIVAETAANGGSSWGLYVQRYDHRGGLLLPTKLPPGGHRGTRCPRIRATSAARDPAAQVSAVAEPGAGL
ncbi:hypothetical protein [Rhodococcus erythropolis]|jgi:hypothetical protein|uniref:hypothetical protein n=1 Tax=Rhodococcus erythropolis TaxID=1833 RepID=UPI0008781560|nr:hypothetical protein [Rhodococcus erythropolis]OFV73785.1 hypothetical protein RERY_56360 [Rhodococcus erythropolis]